MISRAISYGDRLIFMGYEDDTNAGFEVFNKKDNLIAIGIESVDEVRCAYVNERGEINPNKTDTLHTSEIAKVAPARPRTIPEILAGIPSGIYRSKNDPDDD